MSTPTPASPIALPTPETFAALPLLARARVFGDWLKAQPRDETYDYYNCSRCALGQFAKDLFQNQWAQGVVSDIQCRRTYIDVFPDHEESDLPDALSGPTGSNPESLSFGAVSDAYEIALAKELALSSAAPAGWQSV